MLTGRRARRDERAPGAAADAAVPDESVFYFSRQARRRGAIWVGVMTVVAALWGLRAVNTTKFLLIWTASSGFFTFPAMVVSFKVARRAAAFARAFWRYWVAAIVALYGTGVAIQGFVYTGSQLAQVAGLLCGVASALCFAAGAWKIGQARSGGRLHLVDILESGLAVVAIGAPLGLLLGERIATAEAQWFIIGGGAVLLVLIAALWTTVVTFVRSDPGHRLTEGLGVALAGCAVLDTILLVVHAATGFERAAAPPVLAVNGVTMGLLLVVPLAADRRRSVGLHRLPPEAQIRTGGAAAVLTLGSLLAVVYAAVAVHHNEVWAIAVAGAALVLLVMLSTLRQLLTMRETRALYAEVERSAADRRTLLAEVLQSVDGDRRLVAAQLHEQAASSYAAFASFVQANAATDGGRPRLAVGPAASDGLRARLAAQAESLRELTAAIQPLTTTPAHDGLAPLIRAYTDSLYGAARAPVVRVRVAPGLVLDWITETVALRVVQEAIRNVWRHAAASSVVVELTVEGGVPCVLIVDDGIGFDPRLVTHESGVAAMRRFVTFCDGSLLINSEAGKGTRVWARLGPAPIRPASGKARFQVIEGG